MASRVCLSAASESTVEGDSSQAQNDGKGEGILRARAESACLAGDELVNRSFHGELLKLMTKGTGVGNIE
jgi:hypothetical protein